ncbi:serine recombinase [Clostridium acetobutylicum]|nr:serine recombinase [Clostridium acetobutylicum]
MKVAIYSRKSKFTVKGDSIENQVEMCKNHIINRIGKNVDFLVYNDDGFSGKNLHRPKFQKMLIDAKAKKFDTLICYRLDRVSRNIADFSNLINTLQNLNINFISIKEQFDTSTPMGRAMMYIASIFAQLERETIAERVSDNMLEMAKSGRWLGGQTPLGFKSKPILYLDYENHEKKMFVLSPIEEELTVVKLIYKSYLKFQSISKVTKYLIQNSIKTKKGKLIWSKRSVKDILNNPVYVRADENVMKFLSNKGINVIGIPDNKHAILTYNKKKGIKKFRQTNEWIASISKHKGIIDSKTWLKVQKIMIKNKSRAPRIGSTQNALLTGLLICKQCGNPMKIIHGPLNKEGKKLFYYKCSLKEKSGNSKCCNSNIRTDEIESVVIQKLHSISINKDILLNSLKNFRNLDENTEIQNIKKIVKHKQAKIDNLIKFLSLSPSISENVVHEIEILNKDIKELNFKLEKIIKTKADFVDNEEVSNLILESLRRVYINNFFSIEEKKLILQKIVDYITWDGDNGIVDIHLINEASFLH